MSAEGQPDGASSAADADAMGAVASGVGSNLQVGAQCRREAPAENCLMCPLTFLLCPHMRGHNDCLLPTERQLKW